MLTGSALLLYQRSVEAALDDPAPLFNLSAAYFESGDYTASIATSEQALALTKDESKQQELYARKVKSYIHLLNYEAANETLQFLQSDAEKAKLERIIKNSRRSNLVAKNDDAVTIRSRLVTELPRYKQMIRNVRQYFVVGHDVPESLFDPTLLDTGRDKISLLFAGAGDARNLHKTILTAGFHKPANERFFHFTIVDHKAPVIARNVLILLMIYEFSQILDSDEKKAISMLFPLFYYTYIAPIMPALLYNILQTKIADAIALLKEPELMPQFLKVPAAYRGEVLRILTQWHEEAASDYLAKQVRLEAIRQRKQSREDKLGMLKSRGEGAEDAPPAPVGCEKEKAFYEEFGILTMNWASHQMFYEEELQQAFTDFDIENRGALDTKFLDVIDESWKTNPTFIDLEWQRNREDSHPYLVVNHDPFEYGHDLLEAGAQAPEEQGLLNIVSFWFNGVCHGFSRMSDRCVVEAYIEDIATVLEQVGSGSKRPSTDSPENLIDDTPPATSNLDTSLTAYDRIHLSNIPDYIGGTLSTYLHAIPALYPGESSYVTATCLRNPTRWKSHQHFDNEYVGLSDPSDIERIFNVRIDSSEAMGTIPTSAQYVKWHHQIVPKLFEDLLPRTRIEEWLSRLFFKITIPIGREKRDCTSIYSPLNLTAFLRVCGHLHTVGYPAHWICGVLEALLSGSIRTTAHPPRTDPLAIEEVEALMPVMEQSTRPFVAELTTLLSLWQFTLPFGVLSENIPDVRTVHKYELDFPDCGDLNAETPVFVLVFLHSKIVPVIESSENLRPLLLSDELADSSSRGRQARETGVHVISTWRWKRATKTAVFWLREDVLRGLQRDDWEMSIWRTDVWLMHAGPRGLEGIRDMRRFVDSAEEQ